MSSQAPIVVELIGGVGEMGQHHAALDLGPDSFLLDCGVLAPGPEDAGVDRIVPPLEPALRRWRQGRLKGLLLTHGHRDHMGAVPDLLEAIPELPVYGTALTLALALRGRGQGLDLRTVRPGEPVRLGAASITWFGVTHSIPSACSVAVQAPAGTVVHSGDFRIQDEPLLGKPTDVTGLTALGDAGVDLALVDSTNAGLPGRTLPEAVVAENLAERIRGVTGRVVITTFSSHLERIVGCVRAAEAVGRKVAVYGRSIERVAAEGAAHGALRLKKGQLLGVDQVMALPPHQALLVVTGTQGEFRAPLARMGRGEDPRVRLGPGDFVGWSARVIPGSERAVGTVVERLVQAGVEVHVPWAPGPRIHTSGHGHSAEVEDWLSWVRPRFVLPVHGQHWHLQQNRRARLERGHQLLQGVSGTRLELWPDSGRVETCDAEVGESLYVVGGDRWPAGEPALRQRRRLSWDGAATAVIPWDGARVGTPVVATLGVFCVASRLEVERTIAQEMAVELGARSWERADELREAGRLVLRWAIKRRTKTRVVTEARVGPPSDMVENVEA
jgi:ribonuclease J